MPGPVYDFVCGHEEQANQPVCRACGRPGRYVGHRYAPHERGMLFERLTGLRADGDDDVFPHERKRRLRRLVRCGLCGGTGLIGADPKRWWHCPRCLGDGAAMDGRFRGDI